MAQSLGRNVGKEIEKTSAPGRRWQDSRWLILVEFSLVTPIYVGRPHDVLKVSATPYLFALGWISLRLRKMHWKQIGFALYRAWAETLVPGIACRAAWIVSLFLVSAIFGLSHYHQGLTGILEEGPDGVILGLLDLACRRNLAGPIVAHGVSDTIDIVLLFFGQYPGL